MAKWDQQTFGFQALGSRRMEADFTGGHLTSDCGVLLLRKMDRHMDKLTNCFADARHPGFLSNTPCP